MIESIPNTTFDNLKSGDRFIAGFDQLIKLEYEVIHRFKNKWEVHQANSVCPLSGVLVWVDPLSEVTFLE